MVYKRNTGRCVNHLKAFSWQEHNARFFSETKQKPYSQVSLNKPALKIRSEEQAGEFLQINQLVVVDVIELVICLNAHVAVVRLIALA